MKPGDDLEQSLHIRRLQTSDKDEGFIDPLKQLTVCDSISDEVFVKWFHELSIHGNDHLIFVIEDGSSGPIIATGSVFIERKFIRNCGKVGHIEYVVVDSNFQGKHLGQKIIHVFSDYARSVGC